MDASVLIHQSRILVYVIYLFLMASTDTGDVFRYIIAGNDTEHMSISITVILDSRYISLITSMDPGHVFQLMIAVDAGHTCRGL